MNEFLPLIIEHEGEALTTSRAVAENFGKQHKDVIKAIENILADGEALGAERKIAPCSPESNPRNFAPVKAAQSGGTVEEFLADNFRLSEYIDPNNRPRKQYIITKDGFALLAMGFTGAKAMQFKVAYINAFNRMAGMISAAQAVTAAPERLNIAGGSGETAIFLQAIARATESGAYSIVRAHARTWRGELLGVFNDTQIRLFADIAYNLYQRASSEPLSRKELYRELEGEGLAEPHRNHKPQLIKGTRRANIVLYRNDRTAAIDLAR